MARQKEIVTPIEKEKGSIKGLILGIAVATVVATAAGGMIGMQFSSLLPVKKAKKKVEAKKKEVISANYTGKRVVQKLTPIIVNLASPSNVWVRLEGALILDGELAGDAEALSAKISQDTLAYLRTMNLMDLEGPSALAYLRDELNERAKVRSKGVVVEFIISSLVVE